MARLQESPYMGLDEDPTEHLAEPMQRLLTQLFLYKSVFIGPWFRRIADGADDLADAAEKICEETEQEARETVKVMEQWNAFPRSEREAEAAAADARRRLIEDLKALKEGSTEAFLGAAMRAPTAEIRQELVRLADMDRAHADELRQVLGARLLRHELASASDSAEIGTSQGRSRGGSLRSNVESDLERLRGKRTEPIRIILSAEALRHLRDEGCVDMERATVLGLPAEVDFGWHGECIAFETRERVPLAEIVAERQAPRSD